MATRAPSYAEKLRDPRWQRRRLEIFQRDDWRCQSCGDRTKTLCVHHRWYEGEPWEAPDAALLTLCEECHEAEGAARQADERALLDLLRQHFLQSDFGGVTGMLRHAIELAVTLEGSYAAELVYAGLYAATEQPAVLLAAYRHSLKLEAK